MILTSLFSELHRAFIFSLCLYLNKLLKQTHTFFFQLNQIMKQFFWGEEIIVWNCL